MKTEIEVKFCSVEIDDVRQRLKDNGARLDQPMRLMRRVVFWLANEAHDKNAYVRVRDEGNKATMTYKQFADTHSLTGAQEAEVVVSNFEVARQILTESGLQQKSYQETKRETWQLDDVEIVIDEWPWLPPFIEIEGPSEERVRAVAHQLGFEWDNAVFGAATEAYRVAYPDLPADFIMDDVPNIRFEAPIPSRLRAS